MTSNAFCRSFLKEVPKICSFQTKLPQGFHTSCQMCVKRKVRIRISSKNFVETAIKGTPQFIARHLADPYVKRRFAQGYRCRSAFKLIEIDNEHKIIKPGMKLVDLGASPGSWSQVAAERIFPIIRSDSDGSEVLSTDGIVIACDRSRFTPLPNVVQVIGDFTDPQTQKQIQDMLREGFSDDKADVVICDAATNSTGFHEQDHFSLTKLIISATVFVTKILKPGGTFLFKMRTGSEIQKMLSTMKRFFGKVHIVKPPASRTESTETYFLCKNFKNK
uniref:rRNA methyltransferase 2, mitochondrial n=1 Tax=Phallusia mammillata TaxID=59560 RepID=A0A6F9DDS5_9ASCI|nr:putative ribosomal RNA methyltransferase 2 [Phallusia mammillata]